MRILFLLLVSLVCSAQWTDFERVYGRPPVDYTSPANTVRLWQDWFQKAQPALDRYAILTLMELHCRGFYLDLSEFEARQPWGWSFTGKFSRDGLRVKFLLQWSSPFAESPEQVADRLQKKWLAYREDILNGVLEKPFPEEVELVSLRTLARSDWAPKRECVVVNLPGQTCSLDLGMGVFKLRRP